MNIGRVSQYSNGVVNWTDCNAFYTGKRYVSFLELRPEFELEFIVPLDATDWIPCGRVLKNDEMGAVVQLISYRGF